MSPFDAITKQLTDHSAIEESKVEEATNLPLTKYEESFLEMPNEEDKKIANMPLNHKGHEDEVTKKIIETTEVVEHETQSPIDIDFVWY